MKVSGPVTFSPFRLDRANRKLYRAARAIPLRPKTFAVLQFLVDHAGRLVTKDELLDAVWPETVVSDTVLKVCVREIRAALGDDPRAPQFIETSHRSGYRFIAPVAASALPIPLTSFIGREREVSEIKQRLAGARLLTLTGAGGSGKTRLALQVAAELGDEVEDGVGWVELAPLADPTLVPQAVAAALGVSEQPGRALIETPRAHLRARTVLLVLDNCEHLVTACGGLAEALLVASPRLRILATSRAALGVAGEMTWLVPALSLPGLRSPPGEALLQSDAVRLFVDRATAVFPQLALAPDTVSAIGQVCQRLDGLPLAIELAAARVKVLTVAQIAARLDDCFRLLTTSGRAAVPRHQTLHAAIDWSYRLLDRTEQVLLARLSVFAGEFTLEAAEAVCAGDGIEAETVLEALSHLIDKSMVIREPGGSGESARYRVLETVRQYGRERLGEQGGTDACAHRHSQHFLELAEGVEPRINTADRDRWLARLDGEHGNLRAALEHASSGEGTAALRLAGALFWFWFHRGYWSEGRGWLAKALRRPGGRARTAARAKALFGDGVLAWTMGDGHDARAQLTESARLWREIGGALGLAHTLHFLAVALLGHEDSTRARALAEESVEIFRAERLDRFGLAVSLASLGVVALAQEDYPGARRFLEESVAECRATNDTWALALPLRNLGIVALRQGDYPRATMLLRESLMGLRERRAIWFISRSLESLAAALALQGDYERATRLFGAGEALRETIGASVLPIYRPDYDRGVAAVRAGLGQAALSAAWTAGRVLSMEEAIALALAEPQR